jgi:glucans biosynthesis protein
LLLRRYVQSVVLIATALFSDAIGGPAVTPPPAPPQVQTFDFATLDRIARDRAAKRYTNASPRLPERLAKLGYDQYRDIRFRPGAALWRGQSMFEVQFFHRGFNFERRVNISEVSDAGVRPIPYNSALFEFGPLVTAVKLPPQTGFAGFRVHYPLRTPQYKDELMVFLGASYFRFLGRHQGYGLSARGIALGTATDSGEEFPFFTDFWLVRPQPQDRTLTVYALLDSVSLTGAYRFDIRPGSITQVQVTSKLYPRRAIEKLGVAPLTSMFLYGENAGGRKFDDLRPEVHDSDGLMLQTGNGEWLWRPLVNPRVLRVNRFLDENPRGFGLLQRDRDFDHYQDNESRFERRASYWVEPLARWGKGSVELVELPSKEEIHDNIVAYWVPAAPVERGRPLAFSYLLSSFASSPRWPPGGRAIATRIGSAAAVGPDSHPPPPGARRIVVDFAGGDLDGLEGTQPVKAAVSSVGGAVDAVTVEQLPGLSTWRAAFRLAPVGNDPIELRCYLSLYGEALTETWTYLWNPE